MKRLFLICILAVSACGGGSPKGEVCLDIHRPENHGQPGHDHEVQLRCFGTETSSHD